MAPKGYTSILTEIIYRVEDRISKMNPVEVGEATLDNLYKIGVIPDGINAEVKSLHSFRYAYVLYDINFKKNLNAIFRYLNEVGISSVGRFESMPTWIKI